MKFSFPSLSRPRLARLTTTAAAVTAAITLTLTGCSSTAPATEAETTTPDATVSVKTPERIAALDYESAETLAALGLADHLVLIPEAVLNPALGSHIEELSQVSETIPVAMEMNAETVIALDPDLVVMSPRHGADEKIGAVLEQSGIDMLVLPEVWSSVNSMITNIELIGATTGADAEAAELIAELETGFAAAKTTSTGETPRVLVLTNQAGKPFITAGSAFPIELLGLAAASSVAEDLGITLTGPISAEQIVEANPDGVVLIDMNGTGDRMYTSLIENPAVAALPAFSDEQMLRLQGRNVQALGLTATIEGLSSLASWVAQLR